MHYITSEQYTYLAGEINALYHEAAVKMGLSDSVQNILYVLCDQGSRCSQSEIGRLTGISRQTINSAIRKLERNGIVYLEQGRGRRHHCLPDEPGEGLRRPTGRPPAGSGTKNLERVDAGGTAGVPAADAEIQRWAEAASADHADLTASPSYGGNRC